MEPTVPKRPWTLNKRPWTLNPVTTGARMNRKLKVASLTLLVLACSDSPTEVGTTVLLSVTPMDGATDVGTTPAIEVRFDRPVPPGTAELFALQLGDCPGPVVPGFWGESPDRRVFTFLPMAPLEPGTRYTIHVGGGIPDGDGALVDLEMNGPALGGMWVTESMVLGMNGMGMGSMVSHSGPGWRGPNGFYGLAFDFTTSGG